MEVHVLIRGQLLVEALVLEDDANRLPDTVRIFFDIDPVNRCRSRGRGEHGGEHREGCCFPGAIWTEEAEDLTLGDLEADIVNCHEFAEAPGQVTYLKCCSHVLAGKYPGKVRQCSLNTLVLPVQKGAAKRIPPVTALVVLWFPKEKLLRFLPVQHAGSNKDQDCGKDH
jgi:hypothetical protein